VARLDRAPAQENFLFPDRDRTDHVTIEQYAAGTTPTRPAVPSAIVTMSFVSNLPRQ
jgi:hypothetical protein